MVSNAIKLFSIGAVGVGGLGTALWTAGVFSGPYESKWYGKVTGIDGANLVCGKANNKYDCKLSLPFSSISSTGGGAEKTIQVTNITEILKTKEGDSNSGTINTLYLLDKDTSDLWYIFKGQGPWVELKIFTDKSQDSVTRPVVKTCRTTKSCETSSSGCCGATKPGGHKGQKVDENFEKKWNDLISDLQKTNPKLKKISYKNIIWKLSYL